MEPTLYFERRKQMAEIKTLLDDVIETEIQNLKRFSLDDEGKADAIRDLAALHKLRIEEIKAHTDAEEKAQRREMDSEQRKAELASKDTDRNRDEELQACQLREQKIDRYVRVGVAAVELMAPLVFYGIWMKRGFKFEESGVYSSTTFRNLFSRFRPTK
jgi:hypothetical protein